VDVGDPVSQGMIYDAQGADEIIVVDIEASRDQRLVDTRIINKMITKCRLPIAAGGGIRNVEDACRCFSEGADKIVVNTHAILNQKLIGSLAKEFGNQSVVVSVDVKKKPDGTYGVYVFSGMQYVEEDLTTLLRRVVDSGAGEVVVTCIDREGTLQGFDVDLYRTIRNLVSVPLIASGGAGCYDHMVDLFRETDCDACTVGKMLFLRDYDIVRIKAYLKGEHVIVRDA
jgi:cyclase